MTGDHVVKVFQLGYVPVVSEAGRVAFPLFAMVLAYNLAQPAADTAKVMRRLLAWGAAAMPAYWLAFGVIFPLNVLCAFALAVCCIRAVQGRRWVLLAVCALPAPLFVDYQWAGIAVVLGAWWYFRSHRPTILTGIFCVAVPAAALCVYNGSAWSLLAIPMLSLAYVPISLPRTRAAFYIYYVAHLVFLSAFAGFSG
ncbi:TraX family protein [Xanthomonas sp. GPE 39]|uniref:TraX family protein n=1 Tax=Xanthomonas sp. GPE 39 TaxID=1583099 RepID=UPI0005F2A7A0|nr:TraX family protein [Xanthomonas sp. GPE 39]